MTKSHRAGGGRATEGVAVVEVLLVAAVLVSLAGLAMPLTAQVADGARVRAAAAFVAGRLRLTRAEAVSGNVATALVFDEGDGRWRVRRCRDGNGNGVRRTDVADGRDICQPAEDVAYRMPGVQLALDPAIPDVDGQTGEGSAVRFGRSGMVSCSPLGHCSPGTWYLRSDRGDQFAVRVSGAGGRVRLLRFDRATRRWATT